MKKDLILTFATEFLILGLGLLCFRIAGYKFGSEGFAIYNLGRRGVTFLASTMALGLGVAIPRYVAFNKDRSEVANQFFISGLLILTLNGLVFGLVSLFIPHLLSEVIFGNPNFKLSVWGISLSLIGLSFHGAVYGFLRGRLRMRAANLIQLLNNAFFPFISVLLIWDVEMVFILNGAFILLNSWFFLFLTMRNLNLRVFSQMDRNTLKTLLSYGLQRVPGDFGLAALLALPAFTLSQIGGTHLGGMMAFGISLMSMLGATMAPIGLIFLPKTAQLISENKLHHIKIPVLKIITTSLLIGLSALIIFIIGGETLINLFIENPKKELYNIITFPLIASLFYLQYVSLRSILDAAHFKSINTFNILISLFILVFGVIISNVFSSEPYFVYLGFIFSFAFLGIKTLVDTRKLFRNLT